MLIRYGCSEVRSHILKSNVCDSSDVLFVFKLMQLKKRKDNMTAAHLLDL